MPNPIKTSIRCNCQPYGYSYYCLIHREIYPEPKVIINPIKIGDDDE